MAADNSSNLSERLKSPNVSERRAAARSLAINQPEALPKPQLVPLLILALSDQDAEVRAMGAAAANRVAFTNPVNQAKRAGKAVPLDLSDQQNLRDLLLLATGDQNGEVRKAAIASLGFVYPPAPEIMRRLADRFDVETDPSVRKAIVEYVGQSADASPLAMSILVRGLQDDKLFIRQVAAQVVGELRPAELWGKLIEEFPGANMPVNLTFLAAIQKYGTDARSIAPRLEQALAESKALQGALEQTLKIIKGEPPQ